MDPKILRRPYKAFIITAVLVLLLIVISSAVVSVFYEKAVVRYMKSYLNDHLLTELSMDGIRFRFLKGFPKTTVEISNVVLLSGRDFSRNDFSGDFSDTLLKAENIFLQFDLLKMLRKEYELKKIEISNGNANILIDSRNRHNLNIWKSSDTSGASYTVNLRNIVISGTRIRIMAAREKFIFYTLSKNTRFRGNLTNGILSGETKGDLYVRELSVNRKQYVNNASVQLDVNMVYSGSRVRISKGSLQVNKAIAAIAGEYKGGRDATIDVIVDVPKFGLDELMSLFPDKPGFSTGKYEFSGNGKLHLEIKGEVANKDHLMVRSSFQLGHCSARNILSGAVMSNIELHGSVSGTRNTNFRLEIDTLNARLGKGNIHGSFELSNLKTLMFRSELHSYLDLEAFKEFAGIDSVESLDGFVRSDFKAKGSLRGITSDSSAQALEFIENGVFIFENAGFKIKNLPFEFKHVTGKASWNQSVLIDSLRLRINETNLRVSGEIQNLTSYLIHNGILKSNLKIVTDNLDISKYLTKADNSVSVHKKRPVFPDNLQLRAKVQAGNFVAGKFKANQVTVEVTAIKDSVHLNNFRLKFPDGSISGFALITMDAQRNYAVTCNAQPQKINIHELFYAFNNFTQHFILDKNINGLLNGNISFYAQWDSTFGFIAPSMKAKGDFQITNGELVQFEPMLKLSKYIDVDELRHIKFKTLRNTIYISNRKVNIPEMAINSTAFNISVSGEHSFDNLFDYRLRVLLSEVLFNKARKKKREINEFLVEESSTDQGSIPLIIAGTPENFDVRFDRRKAFGFSRNKTQDVTAKGSDQGSPGNFEFDTDVESGTGTGKNKKPGNGESGVVIEWDE